MAAGRSGTEPHFIIIGGQKCGTTYLYDRMVEHPQIQPCLFESLNDGEIHYFHRRYGKGLEWYRANFPYEAAMPGTITGEASGYIFYPHAPARIASELPDVKLIALLRNPIDRALSHYHHEVRLGFESLPISEAFRREATRLEGETNKVLADPDYFSFSRNHFSYLARGFYADQIPWWTNYFNDDQLLLLQSETFFRDPLNALQRVTNFLGLDAWQPESYRGHKSYRYPKLKIETRQELAGYFREANQRLYQLLGTEYDWDS